MLPSPHGPTNMAASGAGGEPTVLDAAERSTLVTQSSHVAIVPQCELNWQRGGCSLRTPAPCFGGSQDLMSVCPRGIGQLGLRAQRESKSLEPRSSSASSSAFFKWSRSRERRRGCRDGVMPVVAHKALKALRQVLGRHGPCCGTLPTGCRYGVPAARGRAPTVHSANPRPARRSSRRRARPRPPKAPAGRRVSVKSDKPRRPDGCSCRNITSCSGPTSAINLISAAFSHSVNA